MRLRQRTRVSLNSRGRPPSAARCLRRVEPIPATAIVRTPRRPLRLSLRGQRSRPEGDERSSLDLPRVLRGRRVPHDGRCREPAAGWIRWHSRRASRTKQRRTRSRGPADGSPTTDSWRGRTATVHPALLAGYSLARDLAMDCRSERAMATLTFGAAGRWLRTCACRGVQPRPA